MKIVDAQVHIWAASTPERPWPARAEPHRAPLGKEELLAEMDKPGPQIGQMLHNVARAVELEARTRYGIEQVPYRSFSFTGAFCFDTCDEDRIAEQMEQLRQQSLTAARRIIAGRPYAQTSLLLSKKIVAKGVYDRIKDQVVAAQPKD